ncbi:helix-turn-helix domain-containing protein [Streptomyces sp. NPDC002870]|uniref:helix-turn-helix domain-containing protein n=1 Tax=Streptomyces sp. NPDC002870 TaxID=3364666 RepID=UPI0036B881B2
MTPIDDTDHGIGKLAHELRRGRNRRGLSREALAERIGRVTTIQRAEAGQARPSWPLTRDMAAACGTDMDAIEIIWKEAGRSGRGTRLTVAPRLSLVRTPADLAAALRRVWEENGEPSLRQMEERAEPRAKEFAPLSRMSAWRIRERKQPTSSVLQMYAYLIACEVPTETFRSWAEAWRRARRQETAAPRRTPAPGVAQSRRKVTPREAVTAMLKADLVPLDPFPGQHVPWAAECRKCKQLSRFKLSGVKSGATCPVCLHNQALEQHAHLVRAARLTAGCQRSPLPPQNGAVVRTARAHRAD